MGCPFLGANSPADAQGFLQFAMTNWHKDEPGWEKLRDSFLAMARSAAPINAASFGCPVIEADTPEAAASSIGFSLAGWHENEPDWVPLRVAMQAIAGPANG